MSASMPATLRTAQLNRQTFRHFQDFQQGQTDVRFELLAFWLEDAVPSFGVLVQSRIWHFLASTLRTFRGIISTSKEFGAEPHGRSHLPQDPRLSNKDVPSLAVCRASVKHHAFQLAQPL